MNDSDESVASDDARVLKPRRAAPADAVRPTRADINLGALRHNLRAIQRLVTTEGQRPQVWGVLKADAYGHGAPAIARTLERAGVDAISVALLEEGIELRAAGLTLPILVMGGYYGPRHRGLEDAFEHELTPVLYDVEGVERLAALAKQRQRRARFHLKVDTGMGRLGASLADVDELLDRVVTLPELELTGLMSHLACADDVRSEATHAQLAHFERVRESAKVRKLTPPCHVANSAASLAFPAARFAAIRPGIALFGISPFFGAGVAPEAREQAEWFDDIGKELKPTMRVRTEIVALRTLSDGDRLGYGHTWAAQGERLVATIPMGYADGLSRALSNKGSVLVRGKRAPVAGIVSMDLTSIDVTGIAGARVGDEVVVLGNQEGPLGSDAITAEEVAGWVGTIPWEIITSISRRVPRFYREP
jgi:alanine racemase